MTGALKHRFRTADKTSPAALARKASYNTPEYRAAGVAAEQQVKMGAARCWRCGRRIPPTARRGPDWQLGHDDVDRRVIRGAECTPCNRRAAAIAGRLKQERMKQRSARRRAW